MVHLETDVSRRIKNTQHCTHSIDKGEVYLNTLEIDHLFPKSKETKTLPWPARSSQGHLESRLPRRNLLDPQGRPETKVSLAAGQRLETGHGWSLQAFYVSVFPLCLGVILLWFVEEARFCERACHGHPWSPRQNVELISPVRVCLKPIGTDFTDSTDFLEASHGSEWAIAIQMLCVGRPLSCSGKVNPMLRCWTCTESAKSMAATAVAATAATAMAAATVAAAAATAAVHRLHLSLGFLGIWYGVDLMTTGESQAVPAGGKHWTTCKQIMRCNMQSTYYRRVSTISFG